MPLTKTQRAAMCQDAQQGLKLVELAAKYGISYVSVWKTLKRHKIAHWGREVHVRKQVDAVLAQLHDGQTLTEACQAVGVQPRVVVRRIRKHGLSAKLFGPAELPTGQQWCRRCRTLKPFSAFRVCRESPTGRTTTCKACLNMRRRIQRLAAMNAHINVREAQQLYLRQRGRCAICKREPGRKTLHLDHDHKTGKIRAFLCTRCNCALGLLDEDVTVAQKLIGYIRQHQQ